MKINAVFVPKIKKNYKTVSLDVYHKHLNTLMLSFAVIVGIIIFVYNKNDSDFINELSDDFTCYLYDIINKNKINLFIQLVGNSIPVALLMLLVSTSVIGNFFLYTIVLIKLAGLGVHVAFIYIKYGISGIKYIFTVFVPGKIVFIAALLILFDICLKMSKNFRQKIRLPSPELRSSVIKLIFSLMLIFISLCVDLLMINIFLPFTGITLLL